MQLKIKDKSMNKSEAIRATKNGAIAACVSAVLTIVVVILAIYFDAEGDLALWNDPANLFDVVLILE